jgi:hypothetical protein
VSLDPNIHFTGNIKASLIASFVSVAKDLKKKASVKGRYRHYHISAAPDADVFGVTPEFGSWR